MNEQQKKRRGLLAAMCCLIAHMRNLAQAQEPMKPTESKLVLGDFTDQPLSVASTQLELWLSKPNQPAVTVHLGGRQVSFTATEVMDILEGK
jgi:hypothetical protein